MQPSGGELISPGVIRAGEPKPISCDTGYEATKRTGYPHSLHVGRVAQVYPVHLTSVYRQPATLENLPMRSKDRLIGCLNLVYVAKAISIEQIAERYLGALQRTAAVIEKRLTEEPE